MYRGSQGNLRAYYRPCTHNLWRFLHRQPFAAPLCNPLFENTPDLVRRIQAEENLPAVGGQYSITAVERGDAAIKQSVRVVGIEG